MAPLHQIRQSPLVDAPKQRHDTTHRSFLKRRDDDDRDNEGDADNDIGARENREDEDEDGDGERKKNEGDDDKKSKRSPLSPAPALGIVSTTSVSSIASPVAVPLSTVVIVQTTTVPQIVSTIWMTTLVTATPTLSVPTSLTLLSNSSSSSLAPSNAAVASKKLVSIFAASATTPLPILPTSTQSPDSNKPPKGIDPGGGQSSIGTTAIVMTATSTVWTSIVAPQTALASSIVSAVPDQAYQHEDNGKDRDYSRERSGQLSIEAEHWLIAIGAIGGFVLVASAIYFIIRLKERNFNSPTTTTNRTFGKGGPRGWYGWRKEDQGYTDYPPQYYYSSDEKSSSIQKNVESYYLPAGTPIMASPRASDNLSRANSHRLEVRQGLFDNQGSICAPRYSQISPPVEQAGGISATQAFYNIGGQNLSRAPEPSSAYSNTGSHDVPGGNAVSELFNAGNNNMLPSRQPGTQITETTSGTYDSNQRQTNHLSYMSSISSGFGDGLIMPEPTVNGGVSRQTYCRSRNPSGSVAPRISWPTPVTPQIPGVKGDRDTIYTTTSTDSGPRFRTINSWVAQQSDRVDRQQQIDREIPTMPSIPHRLQTNLRIAHQRNLSEDPAFKHHPGDEITIGGGSRVPSSILDARTYVN
ncbi:hypothetical protein PZA11_006131 [Diplocarpon coronariae]|uniref:Uncharacterized protein n=1 Tax=Diplocarpon coronariae TaxID=2795749 RepID=A0A218Z2D6_9HELO|nr:hypothetical protein B2J93_1029 [Marssonina coronariae]